MLYKSKILIVILIKNAYPDDSSYIDIVNDIKIKVSFNITKGDSEKISEFIENENKIKDHMASKTSNQIFDSFNNNWCVKFETDDNEFIWTMWLYKFWELFEAWSLCVFEDFRWNNFWYIMQKILLDKFSELNLFLVTNVWKVQKNSWNSWLIEMNINEISKKLLDNIEEWWKLLSDDKVYLNKTLYVNENFYSLNNDDENNNI